MTEEEWLASTDPVAMCEFVRTAKEHWRTRWVGWVRAKRFRVSDRKWRLIELACCERVAERLHFPELDELLPLARKHAEGRLSPGSILSARASLSAALAIAGDRHDPSQNVYRAALRLALALGYLFGGTPGDGQVLALAVQAMSLLTSPSASEDEQRHQAHFVRDVLGNPFRPEPCDPAWLSAGGGVVRRLAQDIDEEATYDELPVLADALEDAGCASEAILGHCRSGGAHVRGCWAVDLLLGRA